LNKANRRDGKGFKSYLLTGDKETDRKTRKKLLIDLGLTATEIARGLGVTSQHVSHTVNAYEDNRRILRHLEALARGLR